MIYTQICEHNKITISQGKPTENCQACNKNTRSEAFFAPNTTPFFNAGLGCVTYGTRDAEKKAKKMGLVCVGNEKLKPIPQKDGLTPIIEEGLKRIAHARSNE